MTLEAAKTEAAKLASHETNGMVPCVYRTYRLYRGAWRATDNYNIRFHRAGAMPAAVVDADEKHKFEPVA